MEMRSIRMKTHFQYKCRSKGCVSKKISPSDLLTCMIYDLCFVALSLNVLPHIYIYVVVHKPLRMQSTIQTSMVGSKLRVQT